MEYLRSLWGGSSTKSNNVAVQCQENLNSPETQRPTVTPVEEMKYKEHWDSKVVEFFDTFPEPYREKAIERFSKRNGLYRFDMFRDFAMHHEMLAAKKGIFREDQREYEESLQLYNQEELRAARVEEKEMFHTRYIPAWEQQVLKLIPLQPGDKMWLKLALSANMSAFGLAFVHRWRKFTKIVPRPPQGQITRSLVGSVGVCCFLQVCAVSRLMDWGPFDNSSDDRQLIDKVLDDCKKDLKLLQSYFNDSRPSR